jgi:hypothetical protein
MWCVARFMVENEPAWVIEYERQERKDATEKRKREMEARITLIRERERREKIALKKGVVRGNKRRVASQLTTLIR